MSQGRQVSEKQTDRHVISVTQWSRSDMMQLFHEADEIRARIEAGEVIETHKGRVLTLLFHEPSTRYDNVVAALAETIYSR